MDSYSPLPDGVRLFESSVHGYGLLATKEFKKGEILGVSHVEDFSGNFHCNLIRTPLGAFINHSDEENCTLVKGGLYYTMIATRDIAAQEELFLNYHNHECGVYVTNFEKA